MSQLVICNCYDAGGLQVWSQGQGFSIECLRASNGRVFLRGLVFVPEYRFEDLRRYCPQRFRLGPMKDTDGSFAFCTEDELKEMQNRTMELTGTPADIVPLLPEIGSEVEVINHPLLAGARGEVERVSPNTGNVRLMIAGKFWTVPWQIVVQL